MSNINLTDHGGFADLHKVHCTLAHPQRPIPQRQIHPPIALPMRLAQANGNLQRLAPKFPWANPLFPLLNRPTDALNRIDHGRARMPRVGKLPLDRLASLWVRSPQLELRVGVARDDHPALADKFQGPPMP